MEASPQTPGLAALEVKYQRPETIDQRPDKKQESQKTASTAVAPERPA